MINFKILKQSKKSRARLGILETPHGIVETPSLVPVATQAVVKTLTPDEVEKTKTQILIANTFHLHLKPGEKIVKSAGQLHTFMRWPHPLMTDSGGFQVFSLGFGHDLGIGKMLKYFPGEHQEIINEKRQPKSVTIKDDGVHFQSPVDGAHLFLGPKESIKIQEMLGADIIFAFDECTAPLSSKKYILKALDRTHRWAKICVDTHTTNQALFGIVQGSHYKELREQSAKYINGLGFPGFGIGGDLGESKETMKKIIRWTIPHLEKNRPRHLLGIGRLEDLEEIIKEGIDTFDCTVPTHYARRGIAFTSEGKLVMSRTPFLKDKKLLDPTCACGVCKTYTRNYISHLIRAKEITGMRLLTFHNLFFFNTRIEEIREKIKRDKL